MPLEKLQLEPPTNQPEPVETPKKIQPVETAEKARKSKKEKEREEREAAYRKRVESELTGKGKIIDIET